MAFVLFRVFSLGIISCMIISFRSSMRNKQHADIAHGVVLGIQAFICRLFYAVLAIYRLLYLQSVCQLFYMDFCLWVSFRHRRLVSSICSTWIFVSEDSLGTDDSFPAFVLHGFLSLGVV